MSDKALRERSPFYENVRAIVGVLMKVLFPVTYHGRENVDNLNAPYIVLGNHQSFVDPLAVGVGVRNDVIHFVGKKELSKYKITAWFFEKMNGIMIGRGDTDMAAMRKCMQVLKENHVLGIFPEGTRHQKAMMDHVESGAALIALRSKAPVIPCYIHGKFRIFRRTHVYFGEVMDLSDLHEKGLSTDTVQALCQRIHDTYYSMRAAAEK